MKALEILLTIRKHLESSILPMRSLNLDEAIAELEALQTSRCEWCKWYDLPFQSNQFHCDECIHNYDYYNDNFEPKEQ